MKPVSYYEFFQTAQLVKLESTKQVVDSIFQYQRLVDYRMQLQTGNDNYWFLANLLDLVLSDNKLYKKVLFESKSLNASYLHQVVTDFRDNVVKEYNTPAKIHASHVVRDTIKVCNVWLKALSSMIKVQEVENIQDFEYNK